MPLSGYVGVVASGNSLLVGESIASWSADFHLSHLSQAFRPSLFEPLDSPNLIARKEAELRVLARRIDAVTGGRSQETVGPFDRLLLMKWRNLSPLLCWEESGFSERHWSELTDDELRQFVEAGDVREGILARRDDDFSRVRAALRERRPPLRGVELPPEEPSEDPWDGFEISAEEIRVLAAAEKAAAKKRSKARVGALKSPKRKRKKP